jgi:hypothetical protein
VRLPGLMMQLDYRRAIGKGSDWSFFNPPSRRHDGRPGSRARWRAAPPYLPPRSPPEHRSAGIMHVFPASSENAEPGLSA